MRLELQMELLKPEIDIDYRRIIISYLNKAKL
jgi:CRISPR-associated endoribonuclease Cas6